MGARQPEASKLRVAAIVGPTAVGKTEAAVDVAEVLGAEIVSCDSMQAYRGMDIGTAKPSPGQRSRVPHHMIDIIEPSHELTVAEFQARARAAIVDIARRDHLPLLVGGSGLYFTAVVDDLRFPPRDPAVRKSLEDEGKELGATRLHDRLQHLDPEAAARIQPGNLRRTVRALEVIAITGRRFSEGYAWHHQGHYRLSVVGLRRDRPDLNERIGRRVEAMLQAGLVEETRALAKQDLSRTAREALGYKQILQAPETAAPAQLGEEIIRATKRFARRQESWFRADPRTTWLAADHPELIGAIPAVLANRGAGV